MSSYLELQDLTRLSAISEQVLLDYLNQRYQADIIYSYVGDILVSINPYKTISNYDKQQQQEEQQMPSMSTSYCTVPHTRSVAHRVYSSMISTSTDQCCIISGESGAGKTEVCKSLVRHLTELSASQSSLELRILQMNPLLEGFGNAQTTINNNSSRFGKYLQLKFNQSGKVTGAKINEYLLEKSRVVYQNPGERNFHVFYWMLEGLQESTLRSHLCIEDSTSFRYLGETPQLHGNEKENFQKLKECLDLVGFKEEEQENMVVIIAAILHLGNVVFEEDEHEFARITQSSTSSLEHASTLLGVSSDDLSQLLTVSMSTAKTETFRKHLSKVKAEAIRDAISKALYDRLFRWIVNQINHLLAPTLEDMAWGHDIGILDIFGFENFQYNSFEQLCINLANEQLHNFFINHIFHLELDEYMEQGIDGVHVDICDTQHLLDSFFLGSQSVFRLLDEQGSVPRATDLSFVQKINQKLKHSEFYTQSKNTTAGTFTIHHYAGEVLYTAAGFLEKNMDSLPAGVKHILQLSDNELINLLFRASINPTGTLSLHRTTTSRFSRKTREGKARRGRHSATPTISSQFKSSLTVLVTKMNTAAPHFIRCLKPNKLKSPDMFDSEYIQRQLEHTGMMATIQIRREGYAYRPSFQEFQERFGCLSTFDTTELPLDAACQLILRDAGIDLSEYQIGRSKLFLCHNHLELLDRQLDIWNKAASLLQALALGFLERRRYHRLLEAQSVHKLSLKRLLKSIQNDGLSVWNRLERLNNQDEKRHLDGERDSMLIQESSPLPKLSPPSDLRELPPPLLLASDDEDQSLKKDSLRKKSSRLKMDDHMFVTVQLRRPCHQQSRMLRSSVSSSHSWLHGMISQKKAEEMLRQELVGTFLVRINRKKLSHILSYKSTDEKICHLSISQLPNSKFVLLGETIAHSSIDELVEYYHKTPLKGSSDYLVAPCPDREMDEFQKDVQVTIYGKKETVV